MGKIVSPYDVGAELSSILTAYGESLREKVKADIDETADELVESLKQDSPDSGEAHKKKYRQGWTKRTEYEDDLQKRVRVYNKTAYQLTHLLEHGHSKVNGGRVEAKPHIAPAEEKAEQRLLNRIEEDVKG